MCSGVDKHLLGGVLNIKHLLHNKQSLLSFFFFLFTFVTVYLIFKFQKALFVDINNSCLMKVFKNKLMFEEYIYDQYFLIDYIFVYFYVCVLFSAK